MFTLNDRRERELFEHYEAKLEEEDLRRLHDLLVWFSNGLMQLELEGVNVDIGYLENLEETYLDGLEEIEEKLSKWVDNPRSPKQVKEALFALGVTTESNENSRPAVESGVGKSRPQIENVE